MLLFKDLSSISLGLIPGSCCMKRYFQTSESVIPECFYREFRRDRNWAPH